jgi:hypothetical protein
MPKPALSESGSRGFFLLRTASTISRLSGRTVVPVFPFDGILFVATVQVPLPFGHTTDSPENWRAGLGKSGFFAR